MWHRACFWLLLRALAGLDLSFSWSEGEFCRISFMQCRWSLIFSSHSTESTELKIAKKKQKKKPEIWQRKIAIQLDWAGQSSQLLCLNRKNVKTGDGYALNISPLAVLIAAFWLHCFFSTLMWLFSLFPFAACVLSRTPKNFLVLVYVYDPVFLLSCELHVFKVKHQKHHCKPVKLVTPLPTVVLTSKRHFCTCINMLCYRNSTTNLHAEKSLTPEEQAKILSWYLL